MEAMAHREAKSASVFPDELIEEILSFLPVKPLLQFRCVNKSFKTIISDPHFVQLRLKKSSRNKHLLVISRSKNQGIHFTTFPIYRLLDNPWTTTLHYDPYYRLNEDGYRYWVVGSPCNGLVCLIDSIAWPRICFWNIATKTKSEKTFPFLGSQFKFSFGYDSSNDTYKAVAFRVEVSYLHIATSVVKVFGVKDNSWRDIQSFPVIPLHWFHHNNKWSNCSYNTTNSGVYLSGTINWLALRDYVHAHYFFFWFDNSIKVEQYVIVSLDLSTETYTHMLPPPGFDEVPAKYVTQPSVVVLMDCLCFCHDFKETHFIIWQMKEFGVQESWVQLFKISYQNFNSSENCWQRMGLLPMYLYEDGDTLILENDREGREYFIYYGKDNSAERIRIPKTILWAKEYVESLVPTR